MEEQLLKKQKMFDLIMNTTKIDDLKKFYETELNFMPKAVSENIEYLFNNNFNLTIFDDNNSD